MNYNGWVHVLLVNKKQRAENCMLKEKFCLNVAHYCPAWDGCGILIKVPVTESASDVGAGGCIT
jgi:hypothetical protein